MANLRAVLQDQEARRLVDEDPDQHSHPLFRQSPGRKMQGARGREGIKRNRIRNERFPGKWRPNPKIQPSNRPKGRRQTEGDRRGSRAKAQAPRLKQGTAQASRTGQAQTCTATTNPVEGSEAPREPQSRSRSHARASASATPLLNTRMTASTSQRRHGATARVRPTHGHATDGSVNQGPQPRAQASGARRRMEIDDLTTSEPGTNKNGTHRQRCGAPSRPGILTATPG